MGNEKPSEDGGEHNVNGTFRNPWPSFSYVPGVKDIVTMTLHSIAKIQGLGKQGQPLRDAMLKTDIGSLKIPPEGQLQTTWVGHATFLLQFDQLNVLTDPVWSDRCSPSQRFGPKRLVPVPFPLADLPDVDVVIISHNHYDHLDLETVKALGNKPLYLVPLGVKSWFSSIGITNVVELDWWQEHRATFRKGYAETSLRAICTPCQHFSGRGVLDRNKSLWCSWVVEGERKKVYFAGDTGFCTVPRHSTHPGGFVDTSAEVSRKENLQVCPAFEEIGKKFGPFDISFIPIGAYSPRYFMSSIHCSPEDAVGIHKAVNSKQSIAMHWGTFTLTDEPIMEPPSRLEKELKRLNIDLSKFITMKHGETRTF